MGEDPHQEERGNDSAKPPNTEGQAKRARSEKWDFAALLLSIIASLATAATLGFTIYFSMKSQEQTRESLDLTRRAMVMGAAPDLKIFFNGTPDLGPEIAEATAAGRRAVDIRFGLGIANRGKSTALDVSTHAYLQVGQTRFEAVPEETPRRLDGPGPPAVVGNAPYQYRMTWAYMAKNVSVAGLTKALSGQFTLEFRADVSFGTLASKKDRLVQHGCAYYFGPAPMSTDADANLGTMPCEGNQGVEFESDGIPRATKQPQDQGERNDRPPARSLLPGLMFAK